MLTPARVLQLQTTVTEYTTLVSTAESVCCQGGRDWKWWDGIEWVGATSLGKGRCLPTPLRFMLLLVTGEQQSRKGILTVMR